MERSVLEKLNDLRKNLKDKKEEMFEERAEIVEFGRKHIKPIECDTCGCQIPYGIDIVCMEDLDGKQMHFCCKCCFQEFRHVTVEDLKSQMYDKLFVDNCNVPKLIQEKKDER